MSRNLIDPAISKIRCAIYTRKSTEERLDQEFNSLDAQREASEAFIASQKAEGWVCSPRSQQRGRGSFTEKYPRPLFLPQVFVAANPKLVMQDVAKVHVPSRVCLLSCHS
jgi:hypothetical protein